jgi:catechol 2,3-dioxygenase-like lactoylglutathione lyase family enzyme
MAINRFLNVAPRLPVADLERTITFYTELLGFDCGAIWPEAAPTFAIMDRDRINVQFDLAKPGMVVGNATLSFDVDDALALLEQLDGRLPIEWGPEVYWYGRREFGIRDPDGYLIIISEETGDPPTEEER